MTSSRKNLFSLSGLAVLGVLFIALVLLSSVMLRGFRLDLTEDKLYSVSEGTQNVLSKIDEPIDLYLYYSERASREARALRLYANRVRETLEEFVRRSNDKIRLQVIDPLPFSEEEDQAAQAGLQALALPNGETFYLGLVGTNAVGDEEIVPAFNSRMERFLEYDLAKLIYSLANPDKPVIGLMTALPMGGDFDPRTQRAAEPWVIDDQINQLFELRDINPSATAIDEDVDVLLLVHPKNLGDGTLYAIDQFILRGGRAFIAVDPHALVDQPPPDPNNPQAAMFASRSSSLSKLFDAWGIESPSGEFVVDRKYALPVPGRGGQPVRHPAIIGIDADAVNPDEVVTAAVNNVNFGGVGFIRRSDEAGENAATIEPLISSSTEAAAADTDRLRFLSDPTTLLDDFAPTGERYTLVGRVQGTVDSAFPDGAPGDGDTEGEHLTESAGPINVIVAADVDMLTDGLWVQVSNFLGQRLMSAFAGNGDFVINALDNLTGSSDLIAIRGGATYQRPFDRVAELERAANERFRAKEQELQERLRDTEQKLAELQSARNDQNALILSDEQRDEIDRFIAQRAEVRKELRQVRRDLDRDIERLGTAVKVVNIGLVPLLLTLGALASWLLRSRRRSTTAGAGSE